MSGAGWQYRDAGSGAGHMQRVASDAAFVRAHGAERVYMNHCRRCSRCPGDECRRGSDLWEAWRDANDELIPN